MGMIEKISKVNQYKSFQDFSWDEFCKDKKGKVKKFEKFNIVFGENGSGKSSICDVLKNVSQVKDFPNTVPILAELEINDGSSNSQNHKYERGSWTKHVSKNTFLFFDVDFINANVHTHGVISNNLQSGAHTQKAGKLIIDLDEQANILEVEIDEKKKEFESFKKSQDDALKQEFSDRDNNFFHAHKNTDDKNKKEQITATTKELKKLETDLVSLQKLNTKYSEINCLASINAVEFLVVLSPKETYTELFSRNIKEKAQGDADAKIKFHFEKYKRFIESAKDQIPQNYTTENCPLCMQPLANASEVIEYYRAAFDSTYETAKQNFLSDIKARKDELESIKSNLDLLPRKVASVFDALEKVKTDFEIQDIYNLGEKIDHTKRFCDLSISELEKLINSLELLKNIDQKQVDITQIHEVVFKRIGEINLSVESLNKLIIAKNRAIIAFKIKYSDQNKITSEIQEKTQKQATLQERIKFLESDKIEHIKKQNEAKVNKQKLEKELCEKQEELRKYLKKIIPKNVIDKMMTILDKFNLSFKLEHIDVGKNTKDYPFAFQIKDVNGNEREFKNGLSEGERQLISISFFFAINENLSNKQSTVLIFDDPITSLDSPNLKILADLIYEKTQEFSQVIVFTHHPLFFKYLGKHENSSKFGVLKNHKAFGGSFIFIDLDFDLKVEVKKCNEEIKQNARNGNLKPEEIALKYGQLLRLAVERFIKHELLMWDKEKNFEKGIIENLLKSKNKIQKLDDNDFILIANIYKYCNYSNLLHADKENPSALSELTVHIDKFAQILQKVQL